MIKERHLTPGRVLAVRNIEEEWVTKQLPGGAPYRTTQKVTTWLPCMVISYVPDVSRRHSKKTADVEGWHVMVMWMGKHPPGGHMLETVYIGQRYQNPNEPRWKSLW